jgi:RHS repeat-associated protein
VRYFLADQQGSTRLLSDAAGAITSSYDYSAFGETLSTNAETAYLYTSQQYDAATAMYSLRARYYAPGAGRFVSRDVWPVDYGDPWELNRYGYTGNNPGNYSDPTGMFGLTDAKLLIGKIATAATGALIAFRDKVLLLWQRAALWIQQITPWVQYGLCIYAEFNDVNTTGTVCNHLFPTDIEGAIQSALRIGDEIAETATRIGNQLKRIFQVNENHELASIVETMRTWAVQAGLLKQKDGNIGYAQYSFDGAWNSTWAISGQNETAKTVLVQDFLRELQQNVSTIPATPYRLTPTFANNYFRDVDTEFKILEDILGQLHSSQRPVTSVAIDLFTERIPCRSCGGFDGVSGVIGEFANQVSMMGIDVEIMVYYVRNGAGQ